MVVELEALLGTDMINAMGRMFNMHNLKPSWLDTVAECEAPKYQNDQCNEAQLLYAKVGIFLSVECKKKDTGNTNSEIKSVCRTPRSDTWGTLATNDLQIIRKENGVLTKRMKNILKNGSRGWKE